MEMTFSNKKKKKIDTFKKSKASFKPKKNKLE